jgi:hypothetical protein
VDPSHGIRGVVDPALIADARHKKAVITTAFLWMLVWRFDPLELPQAAIF